MQAFTDANNRSIECVIDIGTVKRINTHAHIDITAPNATGPDGQPLAVALSGADLILTVQTMYLACQTSLGKLGIGEDQFAELLSADGVFPKALSAFLAEWESFSQRLGRTDLTKTIQMGRQMVLKAMQHTEAMVNATADRVEQTMAEQLRGATASPEPSASLTSTT